MNIDHTMNYLIDKLQESQVITAKTKEGGRQTLYYWIRNEKLKLRKKPHSGWNVVNDKEIGEIIKAFQPGGKGYWHFKN